MRHKESIKNKLDRLESITTKFKYYLKQRDLSPAFEQVDKVFETIEDIRILINQESQD